MPLPPRWGLVGWLDTCRGRASGGRSAEQKVKLSLSMAIVVYGGELNQFNTKDTAQVMKVVNLPAHTLAQARSMASLSCVCAGLMPICQCTRCQKHSPPCCLAPKEMNELRLRTSRSFTSHFLHGVACAPVALAL